MDTRSSNVKKILKELIEYRKYKIESEDEKILVSDSEGNQICIFTTIIEKLGADELRRHVDRMVELEVNHIILVHENVTPAIKNIVQNKRNTGDIIELFPADNLQFNILKHRLQPKFEKMDQKEASFFKKKFKKIPIMKSNDPVALFCGFQKGDVIKISRIHQKETIISYRIVK